MALTEQQKIVLERVGARVVILKLTTSGPGSGALVKGLPEGDYLRSDVEEWLSSKSREEEGRQASTLCWAKIAGWSSVAAAVLALIALLPMVFRK